MKTGLLLVLFLMTLKGYGQIRPYLFSYQIDSIMENDSTDFKYQFASCNYSFIGEYKKALEIKERQFQGRTMSKPTIEQIILVNQYKAFDAKQAILNEASKTRILIINEAHHVGRHRVFLTSLLKDLNDIGYKFIGIEALSHQDTLLSKRMYPIISSGFYIRESGFGNLIREAFNIGFTVFPYEQIFDDSKQISLGREKAQAMNIKKHIDKNPNGKFIIYCGYDHVVEDTLKNSMGLPMAGQLKILTGIDPFTIDQTALVEYFNFGNKYRQLINSDYYSLYSDSSNHYFNSASFPKVIDCNLYQPVTKFINNRPEWLINENTKYIFIQKKIQIEYPCLVEIYLETDEIDNAIPIDVIELNSPNDSTASIIYRNKKQIAVVRSKNGDRQIIKLE